MISTVAGSGQFSTAGDQGPATSAGLNNPYGVHSDSAGNVFIGSSGRVRAVFACKAMQSSALVSPFDRSSGVGTSPRLTWGSVPGAFRYDVLLDTENPPKKVPASNVTTLMFSPSNLEPLTTYYWQVVAKGDPFCNPPSSAASDIRSFTTTGDCRAPSEPVGVVP